MQKKTQKADKKVVKKTQKDARIKKIELEYLPRLYGAWEKVQGLMNELDCELGLKVQPRELVHFDFACSRMEEAFNKLEDEINKREP